MKLKYLLLFLLFSLSINLFAEELSKQTPQQQFFELQNNSEWQNFIKNKELAGINYNLYRITGAKAEQNSIMMGAGEPKGYLVNRHNNTFCSLTIDKTCKANKLFEYADIKTSILLGQNNYNTKEQVALASEIINNITNPFPPIIALQMLEASNNERKSPQNQAKMADALIKEARIGVARNSLNHIVLNRLTLNALDNNNKQNNISQLSLMEQEAKNKFENPAWLELIDKADQQQLLQEIAKIEAFKAWIDYHKYKQNERIEALLATMVATQADSNQLLAQISANESGP